MTKSATLSRLCTILTGVCLFLFLPALGHAHRRAGSEEILVNSDEILGMPDEVVRDSGSPPTPPAAGPGGSGSPSTAEDSTTALPVDPVFTSSLTRSRSLTRS